MLPSTHLFVENVRSLLASPTSPPLSSDMVIVVIVISVVVVAVAVVVGHVKTNGTSIVSQSVSHDDSQQLQLVLVVRLPDPISYHPTSSRSSQSYPSHCICQFVWLIRLFVLTNYRLYIYIYICNCQGFQFSHFLFFRFSVFICSSCCCCGGFCWLLLLFLLLTNRVVSYLFCCCPIDVTFPGFNKTNNNFLHAILLNRLQSCWSFPDRQSYTTIQILNLISKLTNILANKIYSPRQATLESMTPSSL